VGRRRHLRAAYSDTVDEIDDTHYTFRWESQWEYNSSTVCTNYTGPCSNTVHQFPSTGTGYYDPASSSGASVDADYFGDFDTDSGNLGIVQTFLRAGTPFVLGFDVAALTGASDFGDADGVVNYPPFPKNLGGHGVHVVGYVNNADRPAGMPLGSGGGYFVIKNSWGCDWGDEGYGYLAYDYVWVYGSVFVMLSAE
jgi:hypothetical protein